jgi:hypothetical protein
MNFDLVKKLIMNLMKTENIPKNIKCKMEILSPINKKLMKKRLKKKKKIRKIR